MYNWFKFHDDILKAYDESTQRERLRNWKNRHQGQYCVIQPIRNNPIANTPKK